MLKGLTVIRVSQYPSHTNLYIKLYFTLLMNQIIKPI